MRRKSTPTRYPGVSRIEDGHFRVRGQVQDAKTGTMILLDKIIQTPTVHDAARARRELLEELKRESPQANDRVRLEDFATSWLASKQPTLKSSTRAHYAEVLDNHISPRLGSYYVDAITRDDVVSWRDSMIATGARPATVNSRLRVLKSVLREAVLEHNLPRDPTTRVPAVREVRTEADRNVLTAAELARFLERARELEPRWYPFFLTLALTGLRFGEVTALRWDNVDEARGVIRVLGAQWKGKTDTTKTGETRTVPLPGELLHALREHRARLLKTQHIGLADGWVFPSRRREKVALMHNTAPVKAMAKCLAAAGIQHRMTVHGFRRTFNDLLRRSVADKVVVRAITGHSSEAMTEHYSWVDADEKRSAVTNVVALLRSVDRSSRALIAGTSDSLGTPLGTSTQSGIRDSSNSA